jgi:hypothetical protein
MKFSVLLYKELLMAFLNYAVWKLLIPLWIIVTENFHDILNDARLKNHSWHFKLCLQKTTHGTRNFVNWNYSWHPELCLLKLLMAPWTLLTETTQGTLNFAYWNYSGHPELCLLKLLRAPWTLLTETTQGTLTYAGWNNSWHLELCLLITNLGTLIFVRFG